MSHVNVLSDAEGGRKAEIMIAGKAGLNKGCLPEQLHQQALCSEDCSLACLTSSLSVPQN